MTIKECIDIVDSTKPNQYKIEDKVAWLSFVDETIINDVLKTHEGYDEKYDLFEGYSPDKLSMELIVKSPYDRLYPAYLSMQIDRANNETAKYNNSASMYNTYLLEFRRYYNKTHMPLGVGVKAKSASSQGSSSGTISEALLEKLKREVYAKLADDLDELVSEKNVYDIITEFARNNISSLKGKDGKAPVKGVDYFTEAEVNDIKNAVLAVENAKLNKVISDVDYNKGCFERHYSDTDNPHKVTADQVGVYTKNQVDEKLTEKLGVDDLYVYRGFDLSDFDYEVSGDISGTSYGNTEIKTDSEVTIKCKGHTLAFTVSGVSSEDGSIVVNGKSYSDSDGADIVFESTYMESDIIIKAGYRTSITVRFSGMRERLIEGLWAIDNALDRIIAIEKSLLEV